jgi:hypothetical protein
MILGDERLISDVVLSQCSAMASNVTFLSRNVLSKKLMVKECVARPLALELGAIRNSDSGGERGDVRAMQGNDKLALAVAPQNRDGGGRQPTARRRGHYLSCGWRARLEGVAC